MTGAECYAKADEALAKADYWATTAQETKKVRSALSRYFVSIAFVYGSLAEDEERTATHLNQMAARFADGTLH